LGNINIIELNGKRYDALSGTLLSRDNTDEVPVTVKHTAAVPAKMNGRAIDGIIRNHGVSHAKVHVKVQPSAVHNQRVEPEKVAVHQAKPAKHTVHHVAAHQPQHTKTLMRKAVRKPGSAAVKAKVQVPVRVTNDSKLLPAKHHEVAIERVVRAQQVPKSAAVSRFSFDKPAHFTKRVEPLAVQAHPASSERRTTHDDEQPHSAFDDVIAHATSHEQSAPHRARRWHFKSRAINIAAASAALLVIVVFFAAQNAPNLDLRLASSHAGFHATMPGFKPAGFAFSEPVKASAGLVSISFHSNSDSRNFKVIEQASNWDSQTLQDNFVASTHQPYDVIQTGGHTVYIYGNSNATWVNAGVWYRITGNASLTSDQLTSIASSM